MCKKPWIDPSCSCHGETLFCDECGHHLVKISKDVLIGEAEFQCEEGHRTVLTLVDKTQIESLAV